MQSQLNVMLGEIQCNECNTRLGTIPYDAISALLGAVQCSKWHGAVMQYAIDHT